VLIGGLPIFFALEELYDVNFLFVDREGMASSSNKPHPWFEIFHPRPSAKYQVFIFPAAGSPGIIDNLYTQKMNHVLFEDHIIVNGVEIFLTLNFH
jgi:hypothetical protein